VTLAGQVQVADASYAKETSAAAAATVMVKFA
jgi:hypothetical protein